MVLLGALLLIICLGFGCSILSVVFHFIGFLFKLSYHLGIVFLVMLFVWLFA